MADIYRYPYSKTLRDKGEIIEPSDHNNQERQIECITEAIGQYDFTAPTIEQRLQTLELQPVITDINDINNVDVSGATNDQVLTYQASTQTWVAKDIAQFLSELLDVDLSGASEGDSLVLRSSKWVPEDRNLTVASALPGDSEEQSATEITEIRFITKTGTSEDHFVTEVEPGVVYIGGAVAPSDLSGDLTGLPSLSTGRLSQSNVNYPPGLAAGDSYSRITQQSNFTINHDANQFGNASLGNLILEINGVDVANIDLEINFQEADRSGDQDINNYDIQGSGDPISNGVVSFTGGTLSILAVGTSSLPSDPFQEGTAQISLTASALQQGYNSIRLRHEYNATINQTNLLEWFYDSDADLSANDPEITSISLSEDTPSLNYLSGVPYYDQGSTFDLDIILERPFNNVYHDTEIPIVLDASDFGDSSTGIDVADGSVSGVSTPPDIGETMTVSSFNISVGNDEDQTDPEILATPRDPYANYTQKSTGSNNFHIMSEGPNSTDTFEDFTDERYRLPNTTGFNSPIAGMPGPPNLFDSTVSLNDPSRSNELQVFDIEESSGRNRLRWPSFDYSNSSNFQPQPAPDYSALAGSDRTYYRVFRSTVGARTNGIITFPGLAESDIVSDIGLRIKIPSKTVWLDLTESFNGSTFPTKAPYPSGTDGEGCRINSGVNNLDDNGQIEFSLGTIGTDASSDYQLILEITYSTSSVTELLGTGSGLSINW